MAVKATRRTGARVRRVYRCEPGDGTWHHFTVVVADDGPLTAPVRQVPPPCPRGHVDGVVVRDGVYGLRTGLPRQRYRCYPDPADRSTFHSFTPPLARQHIHASGEQCLACRGAARGPPRRPGCGPAAHVAGQDGR